jgi:hypothetical protein
MAASTASVGEMDIGVLEKIIAALPLELKLNIGGILDRYCDLLSCHVVMYLWNAQTVRC